MSSHSNLEGRRKGLPEARGWLPRLGRAVAALGVPITLETKPAPAAAACTASSGGRRSESCDGRCSRGTCRYDFLDPVTGDAPAAALTDAPSATPNATLESKEPTHGQDL